MSSLCKARKCLLCEKWKYREDNEIPRDWGTLQRSLGMPDAFHWTRRNNIIKLQCNNDLILVGFIFHRASNCVFVCVCARRYSVAKIIINLTIQWHGPLWHHWLLHKCRSWLGGTPNKIKWEKLKKWLNHIMWLMLQSSLIKAKGFIGAWKNKKEKSSQIKSYL